jgi:hypothetical protein
MPQKPAAPNPAPPKQDADCPDYVFAMHNWRYPRHHSCGHFRGYRSEVPTRCDGCKAQDRIDDRRRIRGVAHACAIAFVISLVGCCAAGGAQ